MYQSESKPHKKIQIFPNYKSNLRKIIPPNIFHWHYLKFTDIPLKYALIPLANNRKITYKIYRTYCNIIRHIYIKSIYIILE